MPYITNRDTGNEYVTYDDIREFGLDVTRPIQVYMHTKDSYYWLYAQDYVPAPCQGWKKFRDYTIGKFNQKGRIMEGGISPKAAVSHPGHVRDQMASRPEKIVKNEQPMFGSKSSSLDELLENK